VGALSSYVAMNHQTSNIYFERNEKLSRPMQSVLLIPYRGRNASGNVNARYDLPYFPSFDVSLNDDYFFALLQRNHDLISGFIDLKLAWVGPTSWSKLNE
jgi:hypothetical protein